MIDKKYSQLKRSIATILVLAIVLQCGFFGPIPVRSVTSAEASGRVTLGDRVLAQHQELKDNGNGTFTLTLTLKDLTQIQDQNPSNDKSLNGYFTSTQGGRYLIQIWGGDGGNGNNSNNPGGTGGAGGYVYGVVTLEPGQTLYYQLGGDGQPTKMQDSGGGANGNGGNAGDYSDSNYLVGGGGGYSAVYLFDAHEFEDKYLDANGNMLVDDISEEDRISKYIMIAGGGGGGGAGSGGILGSNLGGDSGNAPNGGIGGNMDTSISGKLSNGDTVFAGGNGVSSGSSTEYVGQGGTTVPGSINKTFLANVFGYSNFSGIQPNDWLRTYDANTLGGNGGAGNMRGGSGGAGFTGGSGGVQSSLVLPTNVGGGGGGSSYVAQGVQFAGLEEEVVAKLKAKPAEEGSEYGGLIFITPLDDEDVNNLPAVTLQLRISDYFTVEGATDGIYTASNIFGEGAEKRIVLTFVPKDGFIGGNGVPLLKDDTEITLTDTESATVAIELECQCAMVNVPLDLELRTKSYTTDRTDITYDIITDDINTADNWLHKTLQGNEFVTLEGPTVTYTDHTNQVQNPANDTPADMGTHIYTFEYVVTPKTDVVAVVGTPLSGTFTASGTAVVKISQDAEQTVTTKSDANLTISKTLSYDNTKQQYVLSVNVQGTATGAHINDLQSVVATNEDYDKSSDSDEDKAQTRTYEVKESGYYLIQVWGGYGGQGAHSWTTYYKGGKGGTGGYVAGYVYLAKGTTLSIILGNHGNQPSNGSGDKGAGGGYSAVMLGSTYLLIAGGGVGGGAAGSFSNGTPGAAGTVTNNKATGQTQTGKVTIGNTPGTNLNAYNGSSSGTGMNFINSQMETLHDWLPLSYLASTTINSASSNPPDGVTESATDGGSVTITQLQRDPYVNATEKLSNTYQISAAFSEYFVLAGLGGIDSKNTQNNNELAYSYDNTVLNTYSANPVVSATPKVYPTTDNTTVTATIDFTVQFYLTPREGFLGGNDVPLLLSASVQPPTNVDNKPTALDSNDATDYANVALKPDALGALEKTPDTDRTIDQKNNTGITPSAMYSWTGAGLDSTSLEQLIADDDWRVRFIEITESVKQTDNDMVELIGADKITPNPLRTTNYEVKVGYQPKAKAHRATVSNCVGEVQPALKKLDTQIIVVPRIQYVLTGLETAYQLVDVNGEFYYHIKYDYDDNGIIVPLENHTVQLKPQQGYGLPETISVISGDVEIGDQVEYDPSTGYFTIPADKLVGTVVVTAEGVAIKTYALLFYRQNSPEDQTGILIHRDEYPAGAELKDYSDIINNAVAYDGYDFVWNWGSFDPTYDTDSDGIPELMPNRNVVVTGSYVPKNYPLTITFAAEEGTTLTGEVSLPETVTVDVPYKTVYTYDVPVLSGYIAICDGQPVTTISIEMDEVDGKTVQIEYRAVAGWLTVYFTYANGLQPESSKAVQVASGGDYNEEIPMPAGYDVSVKNAQGNPVSLNGNYLSGTAGNMDNGLDFYVTYSPQTYEITFYSAGEKLDVGDYRVEYDKTYGANVAPGGTSNLPSLWRDGYDFEGWYIDANGNNAWDEGETRVLDGDTVKITSDTTLVAKWVRSPGRAVIRFVDQDGNVIAVDKEIIAPLGTTDVYEAPATIVFEGVTYTIIQDTSIRYTTESQLKPIEVVYLSENKMYTVTIQYLYLDNTEAHEPYIFQAKPNSNTETVVSPEISGYAPKLASVSVYVEMADVTVTVYYIPKEAETLYAVTVTWGTLSFLYDYGDWNPNTHQYANNIKPSSQGDNKVTIENNGTNSLINVEVTYEAKDGYENLTAHLTGKPFIGGEAYQGTTLTDGNSQDVYLWLTGWMNSGQSGTITVGTCIVTITAGG